MRAEAVVAALLDAGYTPPQIEAAIRAALVRTAAPYWSRKTGSWYEVYVCDDCGAERLTDCRRARPPFCDSTTRRELTLRAYHERSSTPAASAVQLTMLEAQQ